GWIDDRTGRFYTQNEILKLFPSARIHLPKKYKINPFSEITQGLEVFFVETKRLDAEKVPLRRAMHADYSQEQLALFSDDEHSPHQSYSLRVDQYSRDIVQRIKTT